jgi:hypothetical protein
MYRSGWSPRLPSRCSSPDTTGTAVATDSLIYALIQAPHNLGAALLLGAPVFWLALAPRAERAQPLLGLLAALWALQRLTGAGFGIASGLLYGRLPDLHPVALGTKILCMAASLALSLFLLSRPAGAPGRVAWLGLAASAVLALCAADVLRWSS